MNSENVTYTLMAFYPGTLAEKHRGCGFFTSWNQYRRLSRDEAMATGLEIPEVGEPDLVSQETTLDGSGVYAVGRFQNAITRLEEYADSHEGYQFKVEIHGEVTRKLGSEIIRGGVQ